MRQTCDRGMTLLEVTIVMAMLGTMGAIAVPTYLGAAERAEDLVEQVPTTTMPTELTVPFTQTGSASCLVVKVQPDGSLTPLQTVGCPEP
jgi:prepilin-type N-terminal cleavage/methylation domain-containing protein